MLDYDAVVDAIRRDARRLDGLERDRLDLLNSPLNAVMKEERDRILKADIDSQRQLLSEVLRDFVEFPPQHVRHGLVLPNFYAATTFEESVFVMTKFPDPKKKMKPTAADAKLEAVIAIVRDAVVKSGYVPRVASDSRYHPILWDNVELYLLGCKRGIAIVENRVRKELNPNVAMEWGWMRGMGRNVLYLVERKFNQQRADWGGLLESPFDWDDPVPGITAGVEAWLK
jgi:hypothetical protein